MLCDGFFVHPRRLYTGPTLSELMTLINEKAVSSHKHLGNRLHGESMEEDFRAKCTTWSCIAVVRKSQCGVHAVS